MTRALKWTGIGLGVLLLGLIVYGTAIEPRLFLDERHYRAELPGLPENLEDTRVAVFADMQVGMWWANTGMVERIVDRVVEESPDAVLLAGDFVYGNSPDVPAQVDHVMGLLQPILDADIQTFAVMGNHDHKVGAVDLLVDRFTSQGVQVLHNEAAPLARGDAELHIVGIGAHRPGLSKPSEAYDEVPADAARFTMMHNPASFTEIAAHRAPLAIAGHTHCGQISIPGLPAWSYLELRAEERVVADGFAPPDHGAPGNRLFVTCGIGFSLVPMRVAARPQVVFFELVPGDGGRTSISRID